MRRRIVPLILSLAWPVLFPALAQDEPAPNPGEAASASRDAPPRADLAAANELIRKRDYAGAEALLAKLQQEFPDDAALLLQRGEVLVALGREADAVEALRQSADIDPERPRTWFQLGAALAALGQRSDAIGAFGRALKGADDQEIQVLARLNRSMLLQQERRWAEAATDLEAALELDSTRPEAFGDLATLYLQAGDLDGAAAALERGGQSGFRSAQHYYSLGARLYREKRWEDSRRALLACLEIDPGMARAERSLAAALEQLGRKEEAFQHLRRYLELAPEAPDAAKIAERLEAAGG